MTIYDLAYEEDHSELYNMLLNPIAVVDPTKNDLNKGMDEPNQIFVEFSNWLT